MVSLVTAGKAIASIEHDLLFETSALELLEPASDCTVNPVIGTGESGCLADPQLGPCKTLQRNLVSCPGSTGCPPGFSGRRLHVKLSSNFNDNPIPEGTLYSCEFHVQSDFAGTSLVDSQNEKAYAPSGSGIAVVGFDGTVDIVPPTPEPSDCCSDRAWEGVGGCDDSACEACVCAVPAVGEFCCSSLWDATCADIASNECAGECPCND